MKNRKKGALCSKVFAQAWTSYFLSYFVCLTTSLLLVVAADDTNNNCPHPSVPFAAKYTNVTGGPDQTSWKVKYSCDSGYVLFGDAERECVDGKWKKTLPQCAVNVAKFKPASSSSQAKGGEARKAVDGKTSTVHEGDKCTETEAEKSPWWTVDLLDAYPVHFVRLTTRCCDGITVKKAEVRVGNSTTHSDNPLCDWIPKELPEGETETLECAEHLVGRYVSVAMTGVEAVLSICEVEVFSPTDLAPTFCAPSIPDNEGAVFRDTCYRFSGKEISYDDATKECEKAGYHLVDGLDELTTTYVTKRLEGARDEKGNGKKELMSWIGAKRSEDSKFGNEIWDWISGGRVEVIKWGRGQPNNYNQEQNCAVLDSELEWGWNDISCRINAVAVCKGPPASCPHPVVGQGTYTTGGTKVGDVLSYHCPIGEMPIGEVNQTCGSNGKWSGEPISCKPVECGQVPGLANGEIHVLDGRTSWAARVRYKCKEDYSLMEGDEERICLESGWSGKQPECVFVKCPDPNQVPNTVLTSEAKSPFQLGNKISYACKDGYKASGSLSRECQKGGVWSGSDPSCEFVDCGNPPNIENGNVTLVNGRTTYNAAAEYTCHPDYLPVGDTRKVCEGDGHWTTNSVECDIIKCPTPISPPGGSVSGFNREVHSTISYFCLPGHVLEGDEEATCTRTGLWSSRPPNCKFVDCGNVPAIEHGITHYVNGTTFIGSILKQSCDRSFSMIGEEERICLPNGQWSGQPASCSEIRCTLPARPPNIVISVSSTERLHGTSVIRSKQNQENFYRVGSTLKYRCERGFILEAENGTSIGDSRALTRRCTTSGTWTGGEPTCKFVDCGLPEKIENGDYILGNNGTYFGSLVTHTCKEHFKLDGFDRRRCDTSGKWEPEAPTCKETLCKNITTPSNGTMILTTLRIGGRATFKCDFGFNLKGIADIECLSSGSWSAWTPTCIEIDCGQPHEIENGRLFLPLSSTKIGGKVEYHCFPGFERDGPFQRTCGEDGYWSGKEPKCNKPIPVVITRNDIDEDDRSSAVGRSGTSVGNLGEAAGDPESGSSNVGMYIGVALGLIVIVGLLILGLYYFRKQRALANKPPAPYRDRNSNGVSAIGGLHGYANTGVYHTATAGGPPGVSGLPPARTAGIMSHPPRQPMPPIQMYSMDESAASTPRHDDHRGPIYDTINDDSSAGSGYTRSQNGSEHAFGVGSTPTTFGPPLPAANGYYKGNSNNVPFVPHDYDIPEGSDHGSNSRPTLSVASVTINGIAV